MAKGCGRFRHKISRMLLEQLDIIVEPSDILENKSPWCKQMDLCRWCVTGVTKSGLYVHVCSWERMGDIIKSGEIVKVNNDYLSLEVCAGGEE